MSSTHWAKKINQLNQALDDNLGDLRELGEGVDPEDSMVSIQVSLTDMLYALETEEDKHGDSQVQIRVLSKADADYLRDNMGYSRWRRRDKTIV
ncbi:hypothetical protein V865_007549 [Kwoniella europaea PYCC6329]|uniref:Uncharacterized protein n=1 Tax=Kwoniella europaea PYCC6329 TaxID=1423913 RepID=A0AAX4KSN9_9TREE